MPPKKKIQKEHIVDAAIAVVRKNGYRGLGAREVALELGCSTQPIFTNFESMAELFDATVAKAYEIFKSYTAKEVEKGEYPPYKATGMAYIGFAQEEKELFNLLFMKCKNGENDEFDPFFVDMARRSGDISGNDAELFHLEMWIFVHGIAVMTASGSAPLDRELVSMLLTDIHCALKERRRDEQRNLDK